MEKVWILEATRNGQKHYLQPGNFWSIHIEGALQFGTKKGATECKQFHHFAAKVIPFEPKQN